MLTSLWLNDKKPENVSKNKLIGNISKSIEVLNTKIREMSTFFLFLTERIVIA